MPTDHRRIALTETPDVARVLRAASLKWPDKSGAALVVCVLDDWFSQRGRIEAQAAARDELVGSLPGSAALYDRDEDWPE